MSDSTFRATVTRTDGTRVYVIVPKLGMGVEYGPCQATTVGGAAATMYAEGQTVLVSTVNGIPDDLVVIGLIA